MIHIPELGSVANWATVLVATFALVLAYRQITHNSDVRDISFLNQQREQIGEHWRKYRKAFNEDKNTTFEFGELLDCYERTCFNMNHKMIGRPTREFVRDHIIEVLIDIAESDDTLKKMRELISGPRTYKEIIDFYNSSRQHIDEKYRKKLDAALRR